MDREEMTFEDEAVKKITLTSREESEKIIRE